MFFFFFRLHWFYFWALRPWNGSLKYMKHIFILYEYIKYMKYIYIFIYTYFKIFSCFYFVSIYLLKSCCYVVKWNHSTLYWSATTGKHIILLAKRGHLWLYLIKKKKFLAICTLLEYLFFRWIVTDYAVFFPCVIILNAVSDKLILNQRDLVWTSVNVKGRIS